MIELTIIILSYNTKDLTLACIQSIVSQYNKQLEDGLFEIIIVDNASIDASSSVISSAISAEPISNKNAIRLIRNKENYGFSKGCNIGEKEAKGKYLLFLNSDTEVMDKGLLGMIDFLETHEQIGVLGGRLQNSDGTAQKSVGAFYNIVQVFFVLVGGERFGFGHYTPIDTDAVDWVSGGSMMVKKNVFYKLGGFDERFFMYVEDMEFCYRANKEGYKTYYYKNVAIQHKEHASSSRSFAILHIYKGISYFYKKHKSFWEFSIITLLLRTKATSAIFVGLITGNTYLTNTYSKALSL